MASPLEYLLKNPRDRHLENPEDFFEKKIRPVLIAECYECHSSAAATPKGGLRLDSRDGVRHGGDSGPAVVPGDASRSLLVDAIKHSGLEMPPKKKLPDRIIRDFVRWVELGAPDPRDHPPDPKLLAAQHWQALFDERRDWWSFVPVRAPDTPAVKDTTWPAGSIDRYILARLEAHELSPAQQADPRTLARRLAFALTGLPPSPDHVDEFLSDPSPRGWSRLVDELLASPHFGERWARHWMDVVRYTDTYGYEWDIAAKGAWRYRDYLVRAFNADVPIDELFREQIAGDLLENPRTLGSEFNESLIGPMFFQLGENRHGDSSEFNGVHQEMIDNKIDAFSKAFQALTVSCSRCHDHKLDPISQNEYYALAGVFMSSRWITSTLDLPGQHATQLRELQDLKARIQPLIAELWLADATKFAKHLVRVGAPPPSSTDNATDDRDERGKAWARLSDSLDRDALAKLEHPLHTWFELTKAAAEGADIATAWRHIAQRYEDASHKRVSANAENFELIADFRHGIPDSWSVDGVGVRDRVACGDFVVATNGGEVISRLLPGGFSTDALSPRMNGAVRTPRLDMYDRARISFETAGGDFAAHRTVIDNAFLTEKQKYLKADEPTWISLATRPDEQERHVYIEFATKASNPNFPPRVGLGDKCSEDQAADPRSWFGLTRVVVHDVDAQPQDELARFKSLFAAAAPTTLEQAAERYADWLVAALKSWRAGEASPDDVRLINWLLRSDLLTNRIVVGSNDAGEQAKEKTREADKIKQLVESYRTAEQALSTPATVNGMLEHDPGYDYRLNIRGDYDQLGEAVPRGYLRVLSASTLATNTRSSGRRELAEALVSPDNPLTARVFVNRVWHWLFGTGIVSTPNNFGRLGDAPSHPELLDHLAARFVDEGWSLKGLVRTIVTSRTWRQSGQATQKALAADPYNRLVSHYPLRRLEAESIRDAMLATSGRLDRRLHGSPLQPFREKEDPTKRLFAGPLDGRGRRSLYTKVTIMEPAKFLAAFNQPDPKIPTGRRDVTSTVAQSLALLNSHFVTDQARTWAERVVADGKREVAVRLQEMFLRAVGRPASTAELKRWSAMVQDLAAGHKVAAEDVMSSIAVWKEIAHSFYNLKEFIHIR